MANRIRQAKIKGNQQEALHKVQLQFSKKETRMVLEISKRNKRPPQRPTKHLQLTKTKMLPKIKEKQITKQSQMKRTRTLETRSMMMILRRREVCSRFEEKTIRSIKKINEHF